MKILFSLLFLFYAQSLFAQKDTNIVVSTGLKTDAREITEKQLTAFADSLDHYKGGTLPGFLFQECFDLNRLAWKDFHDPISVRWKVLMKVTNRDALKKILRTNDKRLKKKCTYDPGHNPRIEIPMIEKSFYELIKRRYREL